MTVTMEVKSKGLTTLVEKMHEAPAVAERMIDAALEKSAVSVWNRLRNYTQAYPRERESDYVRTFHLKESTKYSVDTAKDEAVISAHADYADRVWGYGEQLGMHTNMGWWTNKSVAENMLGVIGKHFQEMATLFEKFLEVR